jgi:hypothetical protein
MRTLGSSARRRRIRSKIGGWFSNGLAPIRKKKVAWSASM